MPYPKPKDDVTMKNARRGFRVVRGRSWSWDDQDGGVGGVGVLVAKHEAEGWW